MDQKLVQQINQPHKYKFIVDQHYVFNMYYELTMILSEFGYFLRVYELKKIQTFIYEETRSTKNCKTTI